RFYRTHDWRLHLRYEWSLDKARGQRPNSYGQPLSYQTDHLAGRHLLLKPISIHADIADKSYLGLAYGRQQSHYPYRLHDAQNHLISLRHGALFYFARYLAYY